MAIDFPNSPNNGDSFTSNDKTWQYNGTSWVVIAGSVSIDAGSVTASKLANNAVTSDKIAAGAVTQAKLAASFSGVTVTTTANRSTAVPSPFTGQLVFLTDVTRLQVWNGSAWTFITNGAPGAPTSLSATPLSATSVSVAFTTGTINGAAVTNYKYSLSTNGGSTYSEFAALDPADITSPVVISGLTGSTAYLIKLRAVSDFGDSVDSSAVSVTTLTPPSAPTSLSATGFYLMARIAFTPGADGGSPITNYEYALSTNSGSTYGAFTALSPADATSPIDITGLANNTTYSVKLRAISANGVSVESSAVSVTTNQNIPVDYLILAGGGGGGCDQGGGGGAGGLLESSVSNALSTNYAISVGAGGAGGSSATISRGLNGTNSTAFSITSVGGGGGGGINNSQANGNTGGSGGGGGARWTLGAEGAGGTGTAGQGNNGARGSNVANSSAGGGGGGAGTAGSAAQDLVFGNAGNGGAGISSFITGAQTFYAGGGGGGVYGNGQTNMVSGTGGSGVGGAGLGPGTSAPASYATHNGVINRGSGGGGGLGNSTVAGGAGSSGVIILRYSSAYTITIGAGLTGSTTTVGANKVTTITAGSGNVSWA